MFRQTCIAISLFVVAGLSLFGQSSSSNIIGTVVDQAGAVVPTASITLHNVDNQQNVTVKSNESGIFRFSDLLAASYSLRVEANGFKAYALDGIDLTSSETRDLGKLELAIGTQSESIEVTAEVTAVQTASAEKSSTVYGSEINEVALKGKDPYSLVATLPGVVDANTYGSGGSGNGLADREELTHFSSAQIYINGAAFGNHNIEIDGVSSMDEGSNSSSFLNPSTDAIAEVKVMGTGAQAEYGRQSGGTINLITKGGTAVYHGSAYWNHRNEDLNANDFFNNRTGVPRPLYRYFIGGYTIGGPVYIPKKWNTSRQKLFFFGSQEYTRILIPTTTVSANEPTALELAGNFSQSRQSTGAIPSIISPTTRTAFPGNIIPPSLITPLGQSILGLFNPPNGYVNPAPGQLYTANYIDQQTGYHHRRGDLARIDWNIGKSTSLFLRAGQDHDTICGVQIVEPGKGQSCNITPSYAFAAHLSHVFSPTVVNELLFGLGDDHDGSIHPETDTPYYRTSTLSPPRLNALPSTLEPFLPEFEFGGTNGGAGGNSFVGQPNYNPFAAVPGAPGGTPSIDFRDSYSVQDNLSKVVGNHSFKTGIYIEKYDTANPTGANAYAGLYNFTSTTANPLDTNNPYSNALLGVFQQYTETAKQLFPTAGQWEIEGYVQDSWRARKNLTLEYGLRFYRVGTDTRGNGEFSGFYPSDYNPAQAPVIYRPGCTITTSGNCPTADEVAVNPLNGQTTFFALQGTLVPGVGNPADGLSVNGPQGKGGGYAYPFLVFTPRLGLSWDPFGDGKTAVRAAFGTFYNRPNGSGPLAQSTGAPLIYTNNIYYSSFSDVANLANSAAVSPVAGANAQGTQNLQYSMMANFTIQRYLGWDTVLDVGWDGNFVRHSTVAVTLNPVPEFAYANPANLFNNTELNANLVRGQQYPGMAAITYEATGVSSLNYHGLQATLQHRIKKGVQFGVNYSLSKALGTSGWDAYHPAKYFYGPLAQDRRQALGLTYSYAFPKIGKSLGFMERYLDGWIWSGVTRFQTGAPVSPTCSSTAAFPFSDPTESGGTARCQVTGSLQAASPNFYQNFNTSALGLAPIGTFGNAGIGILYTNSWVNFDMALDKTLKIGTNEKRELRIRFEAYNVFNHPEFTTYGTAYTFNSAGVNTNTTTGQSTVDNQARVCSLTIRLNF